MSEKAKTFLKDTAERAVKTACQTAIATFGTATMLGDVEWVIVGSTVGLASITSILTSIISYNSGDSGTASILKLK